MVKELEWVILDASSVGGFLVTSTGSRRLLAEKESDGESRRDGESGGDFDPVDGMGDSKAEAGVSL